jgi:hypothetical protein
VSESPICAPSIELGLSKARRVESVYQSPASARVFDAHCLDAAKKEDDANVSVRRG